MLTSTFTNTQPSPYSNSLRQPRAIVTINGIPVLWENITVQTTTFFISDNYTVSLPINNQPSPFDLDYWSAITDLVVNIYIGFPINPDAYNIGDLELFMSGSVDLMDIDPITARVNLSGRDLTSRLIDTKITQIYSNDTASNIAIKLARKHNLTPVVTPTTGNVGRFFKNFETNAQNLITKQITEWDLICFLAQQSGYVVFVRQQSLYFAPFPADVEAAYVINYQPPQFKGGSPNFFGMDLRFKRSLTLANDVQVNVTVPANPQTGKSFVKTAKYVRRPRGVRKIPQPTGTIQKYNFIMAGLTPEQAQQQANTLAQNITLHEIVMTANLPGDNRLRKDSLLTVKGTNTAFDQNYYVDTVTRTISFNSYNMSVVAKNHATDSQVQI
jgi:hypothetical protein